MPKYVDGFVLVVPKDRKEDYRKMAEMGRDSWMKHGALQYFECRGDAMAAQEMGGDKSRTFPEIAGTSGEEDVWFSFIVFESKEQRDTVNAKVMQEMAAMGDSMTMPMPLDMKRMAYGGFQVEVEG